MLSRLARPTPVLAVPADSHEGCVTALSYVRGDGLRYKGQMAGCRRGHLWLHTFLNANGNRVQDGTTHECIGTECSVPHDYYGPPPECRVFRNYAHGHNYTTGGDDTAWQDHYPGDVVLRSKHPHGRLVGIG